MAPAERKALLFLACVALLGAGYRVVKANGTPRASAASEQALNAQIAAVDSARRVATNKDGQRRSKRRETPRHASASSPSRLLDTTSAPHAPVDVDVASAHELESLPGIGPALAVRIVQNRDSAGPFGSLDVLGQVKGIGPALLHRLAAQVTFSGVSRRLTSGMSGSSASRGVSRSAVRRRP